MFETFYNKLCKIFVIPERRNIKNNQSSTLFVVIFKVRINKSLVVTKMLSGQYRSDWHSRHWSKINKDGHCLLCPGTNVSGTLEHMLVECPALDDKRRILLNFWNQQAEQNPHLQTLLKKVHSLETAQLVQFLVDPSAVSSVIAACQDGLLTLSDVFSLTRTYCYGLHRRRLQLNGRFNSRT